MGLTEDFAEQAAFWEGVQFCNRVERILATSKGAKWADAEARVAEHYPHLTGLQALVQAKKTLILEHPDGGPEVWERFEAALYPENRPLY